VVNFLVCIRKPKPSTVLSHGLSRLASRKDCKSDVRNSKPRLCSLGATVAVISDLRFNSIQKYREFSNGHQKYNTALHCAYVCKCTQWLNYSKVRVWTQTKWLKVKAKCYKCNKLLYGCDLHYTRELILQNNTRLHLNKSQPSYVWYGHIVYINSFEAEKNVLSPLRLNIWLVYIINLHIQYVDFCQHISYGQPSSPQCQLLWTSAPCLAVAKCRLQPRKS